MPDQKNIMPDLQFCETMLQQIIRNAQKIGVVETYRAGTEYEYQSPKYPLAKGYVKNDIIHLRRALNDIRRALDGEGETTK